MANEQKEKEYSRQLKQSKRKPFLQKIGTGKAGRYGKAGLLTVSAMGALSGGKGARMKEIGPEDTLDKTRQERVTEIPEERSPFVVPESRDAPIKSVDYSSLADTVSPEEQIEAGRQLYQEKVAAQKADAGAAPAATTASKEEPGSVKGRWNALKGKLATEREKRQKITAQLAGGAMAQEAAQKAIKQSLLRGWQIVHEVVEDLAFSFVDIMIFTGPLALMVFGARLLGSTVLRGFLTFNIKGFNIALVPFFGWAEIVPRLAKNLLILIISGILWTIIILLVYAATHPCKTIGAILGENVAEIFGWLCEGIGVE